MTLEVTVVGAGVIGLCAARRLEHAGCTVRVVADAAGVRSTSGAAGAIWFPYHVDAPGREQDIADQARTSWTWLAELHAREPSAGVLGLPLLSIASDEERPPTWAASLPPEAALAWTPAAQLDPCLGRRADGREPCRGAWTYRAPLVDPARHLAWLEAGLQRRVEQRQVHDLEQVEGDVVVHACGHRASALSPDPDLQPSFGQTWTVELELEGEGPCVVDDRGGGCAFHVFRRGDQGFVVGGFDEPLARGQPVPARVEPDRAHRELLAARLAARGLVPRGPGVSRAGLRPVRRGGPRVEREGRIVHAYGHGGAGFTLGWGVAGRVLELATVGS